MGVSYENLNTLQSSLRSFVIYSAMFSIYGIAPLIISILIAKIPKANRNKEFLPYFNGALTVTWVFSLVGLYFGWYAIKRLG